MTSLDEQLKEQKPNYVPPLLKCRRSACNHELRNIRTLFSAKLSIKLVLVK